MLNDIFTHSAKMGTMTRAFLHSAVLLVAAWMLWLTLPRLVFPLFDETVLHEIRLAGIERYRAGAFRTQSECHALMPVSLFARVETCDPVPDGATGGAMLVVEVNAAALKEAQQITESIRRNESREVCSGGSLFTRAVCTETRPSDWRNPLTKYNFVRLDAYAVGTGDAPPRLGAWRLESGLIGGFLVLGVLFVAGGTMRLISVRLGGETGSVEEFAIPDSPTADPEAEIVEDLDRNPGDSASASDFDDGDITGEAKGRYNRPAPSWVDRVKERPTQQSAHKEASAPEAPETSDAFRKLIARMWVEGLEDGSDRLRGLAAGLSRGTVGERVTTAAEIDHLMRSELESEQAPEGAKAVPPPMVAAA